MTAPVMPVAPATPTAPKPRTPAPAAPHISPYYRSYLNEQAGAIRARLGEAGTGPAGDAAVQQFLELDLKHPLGAQPAVPLDALGSLEPDAPSNLRGVSMAVLQGATFGWGDEAVGAMIGKLTGVGARQGIEDYRAEYDAWAKQHRATSIGAEIAGGLLTGGAFGVGGTMLGTAARAGVAGAVAGAGANTGTDLSWQAVGDRTKSAMIGGATGAVAGGTLSVLGAFVSPIAKSATQAVTNSPAFGKVAAATATTPLLQRLSNVTPEGRAREMLFNYVQQSGKDPASLIAEAAAANARGERVTLVDLLGDPFREFARDVFKDHNPAAQAIMQEFAGRQINQGEELLGQLLVRSLNVKKLATANVYTVSDELHKHAQQASAPYYDSARHQVVKTTDALRDVLGGEAERTAWNRGAKQFNDELDLGLSQGLRVPVLPSKADVAANATLRAKFLKTNPGATTLVDKVFPELKLVPDELPVSGIDYTRRYMREPIIQRYLEQSRNGPLDPAVRSIRDNELRVVEARHNILRDEAMAQVPDYGKALQTYSGPQAARDAESAGWAAFRDRVSGDEVRAHMADLSPADRDFFRLGAVRHLNDRMASGTDAMEDFAKTLFGGDLMKFDRAGKFVGRLNGDASRVMALFPEHSQGASDFMRLIAGQANLSKSVGRAVSLPRSIGAEKALQAEVGSIPPVSGSMIRNVATAIRKEQSNAVSQLSAPEKKALAELLGQGLNDPADLRVLLQQFVHQKSQRPLNMAARTRTSVIQKTARATAGMF
jgi:hypothetical protein